MADNQRCPLCLREGVVVQSLQHIIGRRVTCPTCGRYDISNLEFVVGFNSPTDSSRLDPNQYRHILSALTRQASDAGNPIELTGGSIDSLLDSTPIPSFNDCLDRAFAFIKSSQPTAGEWVLTNFRDDYPKVFAKDENEYRFFLDSLVEQGLLTLRDVFSPQPGEAFYRLTPDGWAKAEQATTVQVNAEQTYEVFISHSAYDNDLAKAAQDLLAYNGINAFCTPLSEGGKWEDAIEDALKEVTDVWVLLTENAVNRSIWVHQELGFFYGYNHEKDPRGSHSRYLYEEGTPQLGLYYHLNGTQVENIGDPAIIAREITESLGREFRLPLGWNNQKYSNSPTKSGQNIHNAELLVMRSTELGDKIKQSAHWVISIRPSTYEPSRLSYNSMYSVVAAAQVKYRQQGGNRFDFPSIESELYAKRGEHWKGEEYEDGIPEIWRISQSGQFICLLGFPDRRRSSVQSVVATVTGVMEFAARISKDLTGWPPLEIEIRAANLTGMSLVTRKGSSRERTTDALDYGETLHPTKDELITDPHGLAALFLDNLFQRFGFDGSLVIQSSQLQLNQLR